MTFPRPARIRTGVNTKPLRLLSFALSLTAALALGHATAADSPFAFKETTAASLALSERGRPVFVYNFGGILAEGAPETMRRSTYLHPVHAPDGTVLTDDFNPDHRHHRGILNRAASRKQFPIIDCVSNSERKSTD